MGDGADFTSYMVARWPALVRTLVLLGSTQSQAEVVAQTGLARCYASWEKIRRADDVDSYVYRTVLDSWSRGRRRRGPGAVPIGPVAEAPVVLDPTVVDPADRLALRAALEAALGRLPDEQRTVLVLRFAAGLSESQVADVLDLTPYTVFDTLANAIAVIDVEELSREIP